MVKVVRLDNKRLSVKLKKLKKQINLQLDYSERNLKSRNVETSESCFL